MNNLDKNFGDLNKQQIDAVKKSSGSLLILAGAGSGKTRVLILKIYYFLASKLALPNQILAVTFTNKAANELKTRVSNMTGKMIDSWWVGTFHSISARILRRYSELIGLKNNFVIIDKDDQTKLIKSICEAEKISLEDKNAKYYTKCIDRFKNDNISVEEVLEKAKIKDEKDLAKIFSIYQNELIRLNCCDFGDLIIHCLTIFKKNKKILYQLQNQFKYILVDEYQDINPSQQAWLKYLYNHHKNICCVGDDDQSIYSWRGAEIKNILNFEKDFENPSVMFLEQNYRSTKKIINCASHLINFNKNRYNKKIWSQNNEGNKIEIRGFWETKEEATNISSKIEELKNSKTPLNEIAILMRVAAHTRSFEERFLNIGLPYRIIGGTKFYERKEIKDVIAYLRIANNHNDDLALERIINVPKRGIGKLTLKKINLISRNRKISLFEGCKIYLQSDERGKAKIEINNLISKIHKWNKIIEKTNHIDLCELILEDSGYMELLINESKLKDNIESHDRLDNVNEFMNGLKEFENLEGFLEHVSLVAENDSIYKNEKISLMTMHSAKGLEFKYVFLIGWEEGLFPSKRSIEEKGQSGLEEERRLAYVALTRAKERVFISFVNQNRYSYASHDFNSPSRFINELPKEDLEIFNSEIFENEEYSLNISQLEEENLNEISPGKKRLIENYKKINEQNFEYNQDISTKDQGSFNEGDRIFHKKFGYGRILEIENITALINFEKVGTKMVYLKYLFRE